MLGPRQLDMGNSGFKDEIANGIQGLGMPPLKDLMATAVQANVYMAS